MVARVYQWGVGLMARLFPPTCLLCGAPGSAGLDLCLGCLTDLPANHHACFRCAQPLPDQAPAGGPCGRCLRRPPQFDHCFTPYQYRDPVAHLIRGLKYGQRLSHARLLAQLMVQGWEQAGESKPDLLVPVPLHGSRLRERGFNQAVELARPLARVLGVPLDLTSCMRQRATEHQTGLDAAARRRNLRDAFRLYRPITAAHVALIDDVVTTGSTGGELARLLKRAGVARVDLWAVAKRI